MKTILIINAGSSSLKYELFSYKKNQLTSLYENIIDRIGFADSVKNHNQALIIALNTLITSEIITNINQIDAIGHRVVHGGEKHTKAVKLTPKITADIKKLSTLAPLHNPANLAAIRACQKLLPNRPQVAVFDTAFHQTMPKKAWMYALPSDFYKKYGIRRYGFHGTSHLYVSKEAIRLLKRKNSKIITCHLGNGISISAIHNGQSIDTSMGFTPLEGLPMGTRCGDIDPAIPLKIMEKQHLTPKEMNTILNKQSGLKAISQLSSDMRDLWKASKNNKKAKLAIDLLAYKSAKYIGSYAAALNGVDALVFTAGMGQNAWYLRESICDYLTHLGVKIDDKKNQQNKLNISSKKSPVKVYVIPTDEEKEIAIQTIDLLSKTKTN